MRAENKKQVFLGVRQHFFVTKVSQNARVKIDFKRFLFVPTPLNDKEREVYNRKLYWPDDVDK